MGKRFLLGIDTTFSPATQQMLRSVGEFLVPCSPQLRLALLTVIPVPYSAAPTLGKWSMTPRPLPPTMEQRTSAERALRRAQVMVQQHSFAVDRLEKLIRVGTPADEIVSIARELEVDYIVIGSRGGSLGQRVRRWLLAEGAAVASWQHVALRARACTLPSHHCSISSLQPVQRSCSLVRASHNALVA